MRGVLADGGLDEGAYLLLVVGARGLLEVDGTVLLKPVIQKVSDAELGRGELQAGIAVLLPCGHAGGVGLAGGSKAAAGDPLTLAADGRTFKAVFILFSALAGGYLPAIDTS